MNTGQTECIGYHVWSFGSGEWTDDINVKSLKRVTQRDGVKRRSGCFSTGTTLGTWQTSSHMVFDSLDKARLPECSLDFAQCFDWTKVIRDHDAAVAGLVLPEALGGQL